MSVWIQDLSWEEFAQRRDAGGGVAILPVGSVEQHGKHLPLGTDTMVAMTVAEDAAEQSGVLVAPPLWYGWSPHHMVLPGTMTIRPEILIEMLYDMISSLKDHGVKAFIVINGHRIVNIPWMQLAAERAKRQLGVKVVLFDPAYMSKELVASLGFGPVGHSEEIETSHILYRHPELVHMEKATDNPAPKHLLYSVDPAYTGDTLCYVPGTVKDMQRSADVAGGTTGSPTKSSAEKGRLYHEHLVKNMLQVIEQLRKA